MSWEPDPDDLSTSWRPARIFTDSEELFVADARILDHGWLRSIDWQGTKVYLPPHAVEIVERIETETITIEEREDWPDRERTQIADGELREEARRLAQPSAEDVEGAQGVVADD